MNPGPGSRVAVVGAGAIGSVLGGLLAHSGQDVTLVGRPAHVEAIQRRGLQIDGVRGELTVPVDAREVLDFRPDLVLLTVKAQDVADTCRQIQPWAMGVPLAALQNGLRSDEIAASILGAAHLIRCVVFFEASYLEPGRVTHLAEGSLVLGRAPAAEPALVQRVQACLRPALRATITDNILGAKWTKLLANAMGNSLDAMTGLSLADCMRRPGLQRVGVRIMREGLAVVNAAGVRLEPLPGLPSLAAFRAILRSPLPVASALVGRAARRGRNTASMTSTLQSLRRGRRTEIDYLNGEIVRVGRELGLQTPCNVLAVELVHEVERTGRFFSAGEVERLFTAT